MKIVQLTHGSPLSQALKVTMEVKASMELSQNACQIMGFKLNHKEQIVCLISLEKKVFQSLSSEKIQRCKQVQYGLNTGEDSGSKTNSLNHTTHTESI